MEVKRSEFRVRGVKFYIKRDSKEIGRAFLYIMKNDLHERQFGFIEDVFVVEEARGTDCFRSLMAAVIETAKRENCYKIIDTSGFTREKVHRLYEKLGFRKWGYEFRMDLP